MRRPFPLFLTRIWARSWVVESPTGQAATPGGGSAASIFSSRAMRLASMACERGRGRGERND